MSHYAGIPPRLIRPCLFSRLLDRWQTICSFENMSIANHWKQYYHTDINRVYLRLIKHVHVKNIGSQCTCVSYYIESLYLRILK